MIRKHPRPLMSLKQKGSLEYDADVEAGEEKIAKIESTLSGSQESQKQGKKRG